VPTFRINPPPGDLPRVSAVLSGRGRQYHVESYRTTLTIKAVRRGAVWYETSAGRYLVTPDDLLVLNDGQCYAMDFVERGDTETCCPFFESGFVEEVAAARRTSIAAGLDEPASAPAAVEFREALLPASSALGAEIDRLARSIDGDGVSAPWLEDRFRALAGALVALTGTRDRTRDSLPAARASTREELMRRLERGRDRLLADFAAPLTVSDLAETAALSPSHFHHLFRAAYGRTPMQQLQARRLAVARRLLESTDLPVTEVALAVGFESLGSFSWLFHRRFGRSPRAWRGNSED
jgi:AraC family transcriptional regulator